MSPGNWISNKVCEKNHFEFVPIPKQIMIINKSNAAQSEIRIGHLSKSRKSNDFYSRSILNSILGGQFSSRINLNLREDKGFTYGAHSNYSYNSYCSSFSASTSVKTEYTGDTIKEILYELEKIKSTITRDELEFSKSFLLRRYPSLFETYSQVITNLSLLPIYDLDRKYFNNYMTNISNVKLNEVVEAAKENIKLDNLAVTIVGDKNKIMDQLHNFNSFPIQINEMH